MNLFNLREGLRDQLLPRKRDRQLGVQRAAEAFRRISVLPLPVLKRAFSADRRNERQDPRVDRHRIGNVPAVPRVSDQQRLIDKGVKGFAPRVFRRVRAQIARGANKILRLARQVLVCKN